MEQRAQLLAQLGAQLRAAAPDQQQAIVNNIRQQMDGLTSSLHPTPPLTPAQQAQQAAQSDAAFQVWVQKLSPDDQQIYSLMQQRQQLAQQLGVAAPEQQAAFIAQLRQVTAQQDQTMQAQRAAQPGRPVPTVTTLAAEAAADAQAMAAVIASFPPDKQAELLAMEQRRQAFFAALQLPPEQQGAALNAINNSPPIAVAAPPAEANQPAPPVSPSIPGPSPSNDGTTSPPAGNPSSP